MPDDRVRIVAPTMRSCRPDPALWPAGSPRLVAVETRRTDVYGPCVRERYEST